MKKKDIGVNPGASTHSKIGTNNTKMRINAIIEEYSLNK